VGGRTFEGGVLAGHYGNSGIKEELKYASYFAGMVRQKKKEKYGMHNCYSTMCELQQ